MTKSRYAKRIQIDNDIIDNSYLDPDKDSFIEFIEKYASNKNFKDLKFIIHNCQSYYNPILEKGKNFLKNIFEISGIPGALVDTDIFAGKYLTDIKGIHKDCGGVFMFPIVGNKTMASWPFEYFSGYLSPEKNIYSNAELEKTSAYIFNFDNFQYPHTLTNLRNIILPVEIRKFTENLEKNLKLNYLQKISDMGFLNSHEHTRSLANDSFIHGNKTFPIMNITDHDNSILIANSRIIKCKSSKSLDKLIELLNSGNIFSWYQLKEDYQEFVKLLEKLYAIDAIRVA
ncbi:MAG: hypothetical protein ACMZI2_06460 [Candidatus Symbiodolus clandestinus]